MSTQRAVDKWGLSFPSPPLPPLFFSYFFSLSSSLCSYGTANVPDSTSFSSTLLRSNLVEFSWVDILLSSRAYLYLAFESLPVHLLGLQTAPSHWRSTPCTRRREREKGEDILPRCRFVMGVSPYILGSVDSRRMRRTLTPCAVWNPGDTNDG